MSQSSTLLWGFGINEVKNIRITHGLCHHHMEIEQPLIPLRKEQCVSAVLMPPTLFFLKTRPLFIVRTFHFVNWLMRKLLHTIPKVHPEHK